MPDAPTWSNMLLAAAVFFITFVLLLPLWLASLIPKRFRRTKRVLGAVSGLFLLVLGLLAIAYALLVAGMRVHLGVVAALGVVLGGWQLVEAVRNRGISQNGPTRKRSDA